MVKIQMVSYQMATQGARSGSTKTGPFHGSRRYPAHEEGPPHYGAKAEIEHTGLPSNG